MAKAPTLTTIATGYYSTTALNDNFDNIEAAFENTLSLDGSTPNAMNADLDMNGNSILNVGSISGSTITNSIIDTHLNTSTATSGEVLSWNGSDYDWVSRLQASDIGVTVQAYDAGLTNIASLPTIADKMLYTTGTDTWDTTTITSFARTLLDDADAGTARTTLGVGASDSPTFANLTAQQYHTRADFVADSNRATGLSNGDIVIAEGLLYEYTSGSTTISDLPNFEPAGTHQPKHFGAAGDGVTDDLSAFSSVSGEGVSPVLLSDAHYLSTDTTDKSVSYYLTSDASVTLGAGSWNPRRYYKEGVTPYDRKVNFSASNPSVPAEVYTNLTDSYQSHMFWINQWGYQEPDTNGDYSGSSNGPFPGGQTRLARTGAYQSYLQGSHTGEGDGYNLYTSMSVTPSGASPITYWSGQNSGGSFGLQVNAAGAKVNLYGCGDLVLDDQGYQDVSMFGNVNILYRDGSDSGSYEIPRVNFLALSNGANDVDAAYSADGNYTVGLDLSQATLSSNHAITLASGQRIGFDAPATVDGKFSAADGGNYYIHKTGSRLEIVSNAVSIGHAYSDRLEVRPGVNSAFAFRIYGSSSTAFIAAGQSGNIGIIQAASSGTDNTTLLFRTASAGTEADSLSITGAGVVNIAQATGKLQINGTQVLSTRATGWAAPTGTATRTTFDTSTVTTSQLAERVKALIDDLTTHGLIGT